MVAVMTYLGYAVLFIFGHVRDFMRNTNLEETKLAQEHKKMKVCTPTKKKNFAPARIRGNLLHKRFS